MLLTDPSKNLFQQTASTADLKFVNRKRRVRPRTSDRKVGTRII